MKTQNNNHYYIVYDALTLTPNMMSSPDYVMVQLHNGTAISVHWPEAANAIRNDYAEELSESMIADAERKVRTMLGYAADGVSDRRWILEAHNTKLYYSTSPYAIYARLSTDGTAMIVFSPMKDDDGNDLTEKVVELNIYDYEDSEDNVHTQADVQYVWVKIGELTAPTITDGVLNADRELHLDTGNRGTTKGTYESSGGLEWCEASAIDQRVDFKDGWQWGSFFADSIKVVRYWIAGRHKVTEEIKWYDETGVLVSTDVHVEDDKADRNTNNDSTLVTSGWIFGPLIKWLRSFLVQKDVKTVEEMQGGLKMLSTLEVGDNAVMHGDLGVDYDVTAGQNARVGGRLDVDPGSSLSENAETDAGMAATFGETKDSLLDGYGTLITKDGRVQTTSMQVRGTLTVLDLVASQIHSFDGYYYFSDTMRIDSVTEMDYEGRPAYKLGIKSEYEGEFLKFYKGDLLLSIKADLSAAHKPGTPNPLEDNLNEAGNRIPHDVVSRSWMRVETTSEEVEGSDEGMWIVVTLCAEVQDNAAPKAGAYMARRGNDILTDNPDEKAFYDKRRSSWCISVEEGRLTYYTNQNSANVSDNNYALTVGKLPDIGPVRQLGLVGEIGIYTRYMLAEHFYEVKWQGDTAFIVKDMGDWDADAAARGEYYYERRYDAGWERWVIEVCQVSHSGATWQVASRTASSESYKDIASGAPSMSNTHWKLVSGGDQVTTTLYEYAITKTDELDEDNPPKWTMNQKELLTGVDGDSSVRYSTEYPYMWSRTRSITMTVPEGYISEAAHVIGVWGEKGERGEDGLSPQENLLNGTAFSEDDKSKWIEALGSMPGSEMLDSRHTFEIASRTASGSERVLEQEVVFSPSTWYTLSFYAKAKSSACSLYIRCLKNDSNVASNGFVSKVLVGGKEQIATNTAEIARIDNLNNTEWKSYSFTFLTAETISESYFMRMYRGGNTGGALFGKMKLEVGQDATTWCLSEDDKRGKDGYGAVVMDIDNEMDSVPCTYEGKVYAETSVQTSVRLFEGDKLIPLTEGVNAGSIAGVYPVITYKDGISTLKWIFTKDLDMSESLSSSANISVDYAGSTRSASFTVNAVKAGSPGASPVVYKLSFDSNEIKVDKNGNYTPSFIRPSVTKVEGENSSVQPVVDSTPGLYLFYNKDNAAVWTRCYTSSININTDDIKSNIRFRLIANNSTSDSYSGVTYDTETVPVVVDGTDGKDGIDGVDGITIQENILNGTAFGEGDKEKWSTAIGSMPGTEKYEGKDSYELDANTGTAGRVALAQSSIVFAPLTWYTLSFHAKATGSPCSFYIRCHNSEANTANNGFISKVLNASGAEQTPQYTSEIARVSSLSDTEWTLCKFTFQTSESIESSYLMRLYQDKGTAGLFISKMKLELGQKATPWCLSENDKKGAAGSNGDSFLRIDSYYYANNSGTTAPSVTVSAEMKNIPADYGKDKPYLWRRDDTVMKDGVTGAEKTTAGTWKVFSHFGSDGVSQPGTPGFPGCITRVFQNELKSGQTYCYDANTPDDELPAGNGGVRYQDFVAVQADTESGYMVFRCKKTFIFTGEDKDLTRFSTATQLRGYMLGTDSGGLTSGGAPVFDEVSTGLAAFFTHLVAKDANIHMLTGGCFVITDDDGDVMAGMGNRTENFYEVTGSSQEAYDTDGDGYISDHDEHFKDAVDNGDVDLNAGPGYTYPYYLWAGGKGRHDATFYVDKDGLMHATRGEFLGLVRHGKCVIDNQNYLEYGYVETPGNGIAYYHIDPTKTGQFIDFQMDMATEEHPLGFNGILIDLPFYFDTENETFTSWCSNHGYNAEGEIEIARTYIGCEFIIRNRSWRHNIVAYGFYDESEFGTHYIQPGECASARCEFGKDLNGVESVYWLLYSISARSGA